MSAPGDWSDMSEYLRPRQGTHIPTRKQFSALLQEIVVDAAGTSDASVSQHLAEVMARYLDAIYAVLPPKLSDGAA